MDIGIDLGTTYSVMAVKGRVEMAPGYPPGKYLGDDDGEGMMDVTILPEPSGNYIIPSVFWWEPDPEHPDDHTKGTYLFGWEAKQLAEQGKSPIMFSKRSMGTDEKLMVNGRAFTATEVATHFLRYLKQWAETVIGQKIERVMVTHPAYFGPHQVAETRQAAKDAGFEITAVQMMMEPCAAAMAFTINDPRGIEPGDALRVMTYDLGGGTFDVAMMEKIGGLIVMKKFEGDPLLGGCNFDKALVQWILDQLNAQGRKIPFDENNPDHTGRRARLLQVAESFKIKLSESRTSKVKVTVRLDFLNDDEGKRVQFSASMNREEYAALIREPLMETILCCQRALDAVGWKPESLGTVLLVGGSTYGQWVQDVVNQEFGVEAVPYAPDYCVAAGAALMMALSPPLPPRNERITLDLTYPTTSVLSEVNIGGTVRPTPGSDLTAEGCRQLQVILTAPNRSTIGPAEIGEQGHFLFKDIALLEDEPSSFGICIKENGEDLLFCPGTIAYMDRAISGKIDFVLPRPLYLKADRMVALAVEGATLPAKCEARLTLNFRMSSIPIPIFLEDEQVGIITVNDIPDDVGKGCVVVLSAEVTSDNELRGWVRVLGPTGAVVKEDVVLVTFPHQVIPDLATLRGKFDELKDGLENEINKDVPQDRVRLAGPGKKLVRDIKKILDGEAPDRLILNRKIKDLQNVIYPPIKDMNPPSIMFDRLIAECRTTITNAPNNPALTAREPELTRIEAAGRSAFATKDHRKWSSEFDKLEKLRMRLEEDGGVKPPISDDREPDHTEVQKATAAWQIEQLRSQLNAARERRAREDRPELWPPICDEQARKISKMALDINNISDEMPPKQAQGSVRLCLVSYHEIQANIREIANGNMYRFAP